MPSQLDIRDAICDLYLDNRRYNELCQKLEERFGWVEKNLAGRSQVHNPVFRKEIKGEKDDSGEQKYGPWRVRKLSKSSPEDLGYSEEEPHGRNQPYPTWEDFQNEAVELLLTGKRQRNENKYPDIKDQIEAIVASLVSHRYAQEKEFHDLETDFKNKPGGLNAYQTTKAEDDLVFDAHVAQFFEKVNDESVENSDETHKLAEKAVQESSESDDESLSAAVVRSECAHLEDQDAMVIELQPHIDSNPKLRQNIFAHVRNGRDSEELTEIVQFRLDNEPPLNSESGRYLWSPSEIAKELGWDVRKVYRLTRILRRRLKGLQKFGMANR
jgi:hypothetical protein